MFCRDSDLEGSFETAHEVGEHVARIEKVITACRISVGKPNVKKALWGPTLRD
jgi:hypothetical protein